jgi:TusA-related sulfurtransferase
MEKIAVGEVLEVLLDDGEPVTNVPASFTEQGDEVLNVSKEGEHFRLKIRKKN